MIFECILKICLLLLRCATANSTFNLFLFAVFTEIDSNLFTNFLLKNQKSNYFGSYHCEITRFTYLQLLPLLFAILFVFSLLGVNRERAHITTQKPFQKQIFMLSGQANTFYEF